MEEGVQALVQDSRWSSWTSDLKVQLYFAESAPSTATAAEGFLRSEPESHPHIRLRRGTELSFLAERHAPVEPARILRFVCNVLSC